MMSDTVTIEDQNRFFRQLLHMLAYQSVQITFLQTRVAGLHAKQPSGEAYEAAFEAIQNQTLQVWKSVGKRCTSDIAYLLGCSLGSDYLLEAGPGVEFEAWLKDQCANTEEEE